jgi:pimeloyl-ACP methyl ester carboxylesterase
MKKYRIFIIPIILFTLFIGCIIALATQANATGNKYIKSSIGNIYFETKGEGNKTVIFVHGLGCDMNSWKYQRGKINGVKEVYIDLPGFGKSEKPVADYTLEFFAEAVIKVMDESNIDDAILVGHSLGTAVCREVALLHPNRVKGLVDVDGVYCLYPKDTTSVEYKEYEKAVNAFASSFSATDVSEVFKGFVSSLAGPKTPKEVTDYAMNTMPKTKGYVAASTMKNLIKKEYWTGAQIKCPSLIICSKNSGIMSDNRQQMLALYPNMTYQELDSCGHFIMMERAEWFNHELNIFIKKVKK